MAKAKKSTKAPAKPATPTTGTPAIDPSQSAATAAAMIGRKVQPTAAEGTKVQSASFRNLKDSLTKHSSQTIGGLLDKTGAPGDKKSGGPTGGPNQLRHNQVFGADVNRRSVPRRTGG